MNGDLKLTHIIAIIKNIRIDYLIYVTPRSKEESITIVELMCTYSVDETHASSH